MSIVGSIYRALLSLLFPPRCPVCGTLAENGRGDICIDCRTSIPTTGLIDEPDNAMEQVFWGYLPIEQAAALFWFQKDSNWQALIHRFKYSGRWALAQLMGRWLGDELRRSDRFDGVDLVIPVPLHWWRRMRRGYNQSEHLAIGISRAMGIAYDFGALKRSHYTRSQTTKRRIERWKNVADIFTVRHAERLRGRHILLVDDVFTTGSTLASCAEAILKACDGDVRISIATLAASQQLLGKERC